ncbi:hypothetical protein J2T13_004862 [Paenibacillus sp. DS2015]|uniref:hypothetical protein n=1 Tax=Paenibacillus sp. DS2015 TaxID=3373917 RepID=UPI003D1FD774
MNKKISRNSILLTSYLVVIIFSSIIFIPSFELWGSEKDIRGYSYVFLFNLIVDREEVDGYLVFYQIDYLRTLYTIGIITLVFSVAWKLFALWDKEDKEDEAKISEMQQ